MQLRVSAVLVVQSILLKSNVVAAGIMLLGGIAPTEHVFVFYCGSRHIHIQLKLNTLSVYHSNIFTVQQSYEATNNKLQRPFTV